MSDDDKRAEEQKQRCLAVISCWLNSIHCDCECNASDIMGSTWPLTRDDVKAIEANAEQVFRDELLPPERIHSLMREFGGFSALSESDEFNFECIFEELRGIGQ